MHAILIATAGLAEISPDEQRWFVISIVLHYLYFAAYAVLIASPFVLLCILCWLRLLDE